MKCMDTTKQVAENDTKQTDNESQKIPAMIKMMVDKKLKDGINTIDMQSPE